MSLGQKLFERSHTLPLLDYLDELLSVREWRPKEASASEIEPQRFAVRLSEQGRWPGPEQRIRCERERFAFGSNDFPR